MPASACSAASASCAFAGSRSTSVSASFEPHGERHELLLHPVVDVALELATLLILGGDQTLARGPKLLDQPHVAQRGPAWAARSRRMRSSAGIERIVRWHVDRERTQQLALVANGLGGIRPE